MLIVTGIQPVVQTFKITLMPDACNYLQKNNNRRTYKPSGRRYKKMNEDIKDKVITFCFNVLANVIALVIYSTVVIYIANWLMHW